MPNDDAEYDEETIEKVNNNLKKNIRIFEISFEKSIILIVQPSPDPIPTQQPNTPCAFPSGVDDIAGIGNLDVVDIQQQLQQVTKYKKERNFSLIFIRY